FISADIRNIRSPIFGQLKMHDFKPGKTFIQQNVLFEVYNSRVGDLGIFGDYHNFQHRIDLVEMDIVQNGISIKKYEDDLQRNQRLQEIGGVAKEVVNDIRYALDSLRSELQNKED
ncbi:MAG: hypothetical protein KKB76_07450, partial [Candidatus Omnitrophica bacterium]|nr:hypothetical protein [Candidatus Omnitrophota bacterium]